MISEWVCVKCTVNNKDATIRDVSGGLTPS